MGLRNFHLTTKKVHGIEVRGVSLNDIAVLTETYGPAMVKLFKLATEHSQADQSSVGAVMSAAAKESPNLAATVIALVIMLDDGEEPTPLGDAMSIINDMSVGIQTELLEAIFTCTFETDADIKKMVEAVTRMLNKLAEAVEQVPQLPSENSSSGSDAK